MADHLDDVDQPSDDAPALRVGFVGVGHQGAPMAAAILGAGFPTTLWARRASALDRFRDTPAMLAASLAELASASDVVGVCVLDDAAVDEVLGGADGIVANLRPGSVIVVHSTVSPGLCQRWAREAATRGAALLDAPLSNATTPQNDFATSANTAASSVGRALAVFVGGDQSTFERCRPVLESFGTVIRHLGPVGAGQYAKLLNNALFYANLALTHAALTAGHGFGVDPAALLDILRCSSSRTHAMDIVAGHIRPLDAVREIAADIGRLVEKDVSLLLDAAPRRGIDLAVLRGVALETLRVFSAAQQEAARGREATSG